MNSWTTASILVTALIIAAGAPLRGNTQEGSEEAPEKAGDVRENLQVLGDLDADELLPLMSFFQSSLGVRCNHCHERPFSSDAKEEKRIAREMIRMVEQINTTLEDRNVRVNCYTCHRGSTTPQTMIAMDLVTHPPIEAEDEAASTTPTLPDVSQVVDRFILASGGERALLEARGFVGKGSISSSRGHSGSITLYREGDSRSTEIREWSDGVVSRSGFLGDRSWRQTDSDPATWRSETDTARIGEQLVVDSPLLLRELTNPSAHPEVETLDGRQMYVVEMKTSLPATRRLLYFDSESGLLRRFLTLTQTHLGENPQAIDLADYRWVGDVRVPFLRSTVAPDIVVSVELDSVELVEEIPDDVFAIPEPSSP